MNGGWLRAAGAGRPYVRAALDRALLGGLSTSPLEVALDRSVQALGPFTRTLVALTRVFGAFAVAGGLVLLARCAWHLAEGARRWSQEYFAVLFGVALVIAGIVYLRAPLCRSQRESGRDASSRDGWRSAVVKAPSNNRWRGP